MTINRHWIDVTCMIVLLSSGTHNAVLQDLSRLSITVFARLHNEFSERPAQLSHPIAQMVTSIAT